MRSRILFFTVLGIVVLGIIAGAIYFQTQKGLGPESTPTPTDNPAAGASPSLEASPGTPTESKATNTNPDLTVDANGLSKATVIMTTSQGVVKFKLYPSDAPNTVKRIIELTNQGFYNGLVFHRVIPGFVAQTGDPQGTGTGGSGQKLKAEFNDRHHVEGTLAMARAADPDSADSQFYVTLAPQPHLDKSYTVFGQVIEGMDVAKKIQRGDKIVTMIIE